MMNFENDALIFHIYDRKSYDICLKTNFNEANTTHPLSLVIIDVDHFKEVNDNYGHLQGNQILITIGEILSNISDGKGYAFRYGGEELILILPNFSLEEAKAVADRIRITVENHVFALTDQNNSINCTVSIGISMYPDGVISTEEELFKRADDALYEAKNNGRNRVCIAEPENKIEKKKQPPTLEAECIPTGSKCYVLKRSDYLFIILQIKFTNRSNHSTTVQFTGIEVLIDDSWKAAERSVHSAGSIIEEHRSHIHADYCATPGSYDDIELNAKGTKIVYLAFLLNVSVKLDLEDVEIKGIVEDLDGRKAEISGKIQRYKR